MADGMQQVIKKHENEWLYVVDEKDDVIGREQFDLAHEKGLLHRFTRVLVLNTEGKVVLHQRQASQVGKWDSAGGHVHFGEEYPVSARRELQEEMGIEAELTDIGRLRLNAQTAKYLENMIGRLFICRHDGPYSESDESLNFRAFTPAEIDAMVAEKTPVSAQMIEAWACYRKWSEKNEY